MKKYLILFFTVISVILIIIASGYTRIDNIDYVKGAIIESTHAAKIINCSGKIVYAGTNECIAHGSGIVQYVFVREGDHVNVGDVIMITAETKADIELADIYSAALSENGDIGSIVKKTLDKEISITSYTAEISGIIHNITAEVNGIYTKGSSMFEIYQDNTTFEIEADVPASVIGKVEVGQSVEIDVRAMPYMVKGEVKEIDNYAKQTGSAFEKETTVKVIISVENNYSDLKSGYTADCKIKVQEKDNVLLVPFSSVEADENGETFVYILNSNKCEKHIVVCGEEYSGGIEIVDGLKSGDIVVYDVSGIDETKENVIGEVKAFEQ